MEVAAALAHALASQSKVLDLSGTGRRELNVPYPGLTPPQVRQDAHHFHRLPMYQSDEVLTASNRRTPPQLDELGNALPRRAVETLNFSGSLIGDAGLRALAAGMAGHRSVHGLWLGNCDVGPDGVATLCSHVLGAHANHAANRIQAFARAFLGRQRLWARVPPDARIRLQVGALNGFERRASIQPGQQ